VHLHWIADFVDYRTFFSNVNKPIVWTLHDMNPFTGGCHYAMGCNNFRDQCGMCPQLGESGNEDLSRQIWKRKQYAMSALRSRQLHIVATSRWMQREAQSSPLLSQIPVSFIPLGLNTDLYLPCDGDGFRSSLGISKDARVVLFAAESIENKRKGFSELLQALAMLNVDEDVILLTVGKSIPKLTGHFSHIHLGFIDSCDLMSAIYSAADIFVIPSLQEAFGQTALEAMACGTPVVGFSVGGIVDTVRPGVTGILVPEGDVGGLSEVISRLLTDTEQCRIMGNNARRMVVEEYSLGVMTDRYIKLYEDLTPQLES
ncbi:MAG: glycosyltransferase family 4 protein, partial [Mariprofundaceae bacterium]